jgi:hypothetical protein
VALIEKQPGETTGMVEDWNNGVKTKNHFDYN